MKYPLLLLNLLLLLAISGRSQDVPKEPTDISPLLIGEKIPNLKLSNIDGNEIGLLELAGQKHAILVFYRGGWCPYCNTQMAELQAIEPDLLREGYQIIAISPDSPESLKASVDKNKLNYTLLSDSKLEAARAFGLAFAAPERYADMLLKASSNLNKGVLPVPAVFVLNKQGEILFEYINPNYKKRLKGSFLLTAARELKE
ncbi:MAG: peroxiredoxin-like family protein [Cytophagales bacterium]|nr:peroxiredoxin-like family protein [Cytophagales bacterium]